MFNFLSENSLYIVLIIVLVCWIGIFFYLIRLDRKLSNLEKQMKK
ncbi:MAG TPA: CcmD family protein [Bacteroidota bacterium]|nr:CcmD family protein [Bacteroidota bacterium]